MPKNKQKLQGVDVNDQVKPQLVFDPPTVHYIDKNGAEQQVELAPNKMLVYSQSVKSEGRPRMESAAWLKYTDLNNVGIIYYGVESNSSFCVQIELTNSVTYGSYTRSWFTWDPYETLVAETLAPLKDSQYRPQISQEKVHGAEVLTLNEPLSLRSLQDHLDSAVHSVDGALYDIGLASRLFSAYGEQNTKICQKFLADVLSDEKTALDFCQRVLHLAPARRSE